MDTTALVTGRPRVWARDMAIFGGVTCVAVPGILHTFAPDLYFVWAGLAGMLTGGVLGLVMPRALEALRGRVPIKVLVTLGFPIGAAWGALVGLLASAPYGFSGSVVALGVVCASLAGAVQFGWWWFPYTFQTVRGRRTWPLTVVAVLATPVLAWLAFAAAMFAMSV